MSIETKKFARKTYEVDAVQVTAENIDEIAKWCGGEVRTNSKTDTEEKYVKVFVFRPMNDRQTQAFVGDWVLYSGTGFKVFTSKAFENAFEPAKEWDFNEIAMPVVE